MATDPICLPTRAAPRRLADEVNFRPSAKCNSQAAQTASPPCQDTPSWGDAILDAIETAALVLDRAARVCQANAAAAGLLNRSWPLRMHDGRLVAAQPYPNDTIRDLIMRSLASRVSQGIMLRERFNNRGLWVLSTPLSSRASPTDTAGFVLLQLSTPWEETPANIHLVREAFGLTLAEARVVCALAEGKTAEAYACLAGVSLSTIRTQIRASLEKTGTCRQSDLVRLVARVSGA